MIKLSCFQNPLFYKAVDKPSKGLVLILHGRGDSARGISFMRHHLKIPDRDFLFLNAPDDWPLAFGAPGYSWYPLAPDHRDGIDRSLCMLQEAFNELKEQGYEEKNIILMGFSQGCLMSLEYSLRASVQFEAVIGISGVIYDLEKLIDEISPAGTGQNILLTHGYQDEVLPYENSKHMAESIQEKVPSLEFHSFSKGHTIISPEFDLIREFIASVQRRRKFFRA